MKSTIKRRLNDLLERPRLDQARQQHALRDEPVQRRRGDPDIGGGDPAGQHLDDSGRAVASLSAVIDCHPWRVLLL